MLITVEIMEYQYKKMEPDKIREVKKKKKKKIKQCYGE